MTDRRAFLQALAALPALRVPPPGGPPAIDARATPLYAQPDGRNNLVRISVTGLAAPAARARVSDRHGHLVGTAGLLPGPGGATLAGEVWVPLSEAGDFDIEVDVGKSRKAHRRVHLTPP
ncbi:MAG TPA: hypothetical protein VNG95_03105, partial [Gemmatimonadales bacterium]|nr:hypothetical protein [Gemmatimonadales bacterium]